MATLSTKTITLGPGDCVILPAGATVTSVILNGAITATSSCNNLPTATTYKCGVFYFFIDETGTDDSAMEEEHVRYNIVTIGGTTYTLDESADGITIGELNAHITDLPLFEFMSIQETVLSERKRLAVYFQTPADLFDDVVLQLSDRGTLYNLPPYEAVCGEYPVPE